MNRVIKGDIILSFAAFFQIAVLMLQQLLINSNVVSYESFEIVSVIISAIPMIFAFYYIVKRKLILALSAYLLVATLILLTLLFYPDNKQYISSETFYLLLINLPCFLCLASIEDFDVLKRVLLFLSYIIFALGMVYVVFLWNGKIAFSTYSMTYSYYLLIPALVFVSQKKVIYTFIFVLICLVIFLLGSRGAIVTAFCYALILAYIDEKNRKNMLIITAVIVGILLSGSLLTILFKLSDKLEITSRTLDLFLKGSIGQDSGRNELYSLTWNSILERPIKGYGIFGDRVLLDGIYCHNFFLEIFSNFGILLGSVLILFILVLVIRVFHIMDKNHIKLFILLFCYCFIPLMVSSSYLIYPGFGIFIGSLISFSRNNAEIKSFI